MQIQVLSIFDINREDAIEGVKKILDGPDVNSETIGMVIKESVRMAVEKLLKANFGDNNISIIPDPPPSPMINSHVYSIVRYTNIGPKDFLCEVRDKTQDKPKQWCEDSLDAAVQHVIQEALETNGEVITRSNINIER